MRDDRLYRRVEIFIELFDFKKINFVCEVYLKVFEEYLREFKVSEGFKSFLIATNFEEILRA